MAKHKWKLAVVIGIVLAAGILTAALLADQDAGVLRYQSGNKPLRTVTELARDAKQAGVKEIILTHIISAHADFFRGLDQAPREYTLVHAILKEKRTVVPSPSSHSLHTYLRFERREQLFGPHANPTPVPDYIPEDLRNIPPTEFVLSVSSDGETTIDGVLVKSGNNLLHELLPGNDYLLLAWLKLHPDFGSLAFGLDGVFAVADGGDLTPLRPDGPVAAEFKTLSLKRLADVHRYVSRLPRN